MARCVFSSSPAEAVGRGHLHHDQDEWIYIIDGEFKFEIGDKRFRVGAGESVFIPRKVPHVWACVSGKPARILGLDCHSGKIINVYQPAGKMEEFFRELGKDNGKPYAHEVLSIDELRQLFHDHGMELLGPPLLGEWKVEEDGITQVA